MKYLLSVIPVLFITCSVPMSERPTVRTVPLIIDKCDPVHFRVVVLVTDTEEKAEIKQMELAALQPYPVIVEKAGGQLSLFVGRFRNRRTAVKLQNELIDLGYAGAAVVTMPGRYNE